MKLGDNNIKHIDFDRDVGSFETAPSIKNIQQQRQETLQSEVYITEIENQAAKAKSRELETRGLC